VKTGHVLLVANHLCIQDKLQLTQLTLKLDRLNTNFLKLDDMQLGVKVKQKDIPETQKREFISYY
jgi:hypothetical protein